MTCNKAADSRFCKFTGMTFTRSALSALIVFAVVSSPGAFAQGSAKDGAHAKEAAPGSHSIDEGIKLYQAGDYNKARFSFEKAVSENPKSWQAHYYLANIYLALGKYASAKYEYSTCERVTTNAAVKQRCQAGLEQVSKRSASQSTGGSSSTASTAGGESDDKPAGKEKSGKIEGGDTKSSAKSDSGSAPKSASDRRRDEILKKAKDDCAAIKKAAKEQIDSEKANSNQFVYGADGSRSLGIPEEREKEIMQEAENKCKRIMEEAERNAKSVR